MSWNIPEIGKLISGVKTEIIKTEGELPVVHVQFPPGTPKERSSAFAKAMREEFPVNVKIVFTTPGVKIEVHRPKVINLTISDCVVTVEELENNINKILEDQADVVNIRIHNITWEGKK